MPLRRARVAPLVALVPLLLVGSTVAAEEGRDNEPAAPAQNLKSIDDVEAFLDSWNGSADELQAVYDGLDAESRALIDSLVELWALDGGLGVLGGFGTPLGGDASGGGLFRLEAALGVTWPIGRYDLPIYYAVDDIAWPWATGFQVFGGADNFKAFYGGAVWHWAYDYVGATPWVDLGGLVRYQDKLAPGARLALGYGNILLQGYAAADLVFEDDPLLTVTAGLRLPWLLFLPSTWELLADYL